MNQAQMIDAMEELLDLMECGLLINHPDLCQENRERIEIAYAKAEALCFDAKREAA